MRFKIFSTLAVASIFFVASCGKKDSGGGTTPTTDKPVVNVTKSNIAADGFDETVISVKDANGNDVTQQCFITGNGIQITSFNHSTTTPGAINIVAKLGGVSSAAVTINAAAPANRHTKKVLAEDYTGAWCGWCPRVAKSLDDLATSTGGKVIPVAVHNGDALVYSLESQMRARWGVSGFPTAIVNRNFAWNENASQINNELTKWAAAGLAIESAVNGTTISGKAKAQFNVTSTSKPLTITVMLLEDGKVLAQRNFFSNNPTYSTSPFFSQPDPIAGYVHNHTLRAASTSIFGDQIPQASIVKDNVFEKTFSFNATGYDVTKCYIVAVVSYADGQASKGSINAQMVKAGQTINFD